MKRFIIPLLGILVAGCVTDNTGSTGEQAKEYLELWMAKWNQDNGKNVQPTDLGLYILDDIPGPATADLWSADLPYTYAVVTIRSLNGKVSSTDDPDIAKQIGTYSTTSYFGPKVIINGENYNYAGIEAALKDMRMGGKRTVVIPSWLLTTSRYSSIDKYLEACTSSSHLIYTIEVREQFADVTEWEKANILAYVNANFPGATPTLMPDAEDGAEPDGTYWFITDVTGFSEDDIRSETDSGYSLNYTGKRLDGTVFDTSVMKTAVDNDIYNSSNSYSPLSVSFYSDWSSTTISNSTNFVDGFKAGVSQMWWGGQKATVIFTSGHGYGASGSGAIPGYCPMVFEIELLPKE